MSYYGVNYSASVDQNSEDERKLHHPREAGDVTFIEGREHLADKSEDVADVGWPPEKSRRAVRCEVIQEFVCPSQVVLSVKPDRGQVREIKLTQVSLSARTQ